MNKKKVSLIGLGVGLIGTALAVTVYQKKKKVTPLSELNTQSNVIENILNTLESLYETLDSVKESDMPYTEKTKKTLVIIKKIQRQLKAVGKLNEIENVPEEIVDIYEDLQMLKNKISEAIEKVDIFNEYSLDLLRSYLLTFENTLEIIKNDLSDYENELNTDVIETEVLSEKENKATSERNKDLKETVKKIMGKDTKSELTYSLQTVPFDNINSTNVDVEVAVDIKDEDEVQIVE